MQLVIHTQFMENYAAHNEDFEPGVSEDYWKYKGGDSYTGGLGESYSAQDCATIISQLEPLIEYSYASAKEYIIDPFVVVKLANFEVTVLGEVNNPGTYPVYKENLTIFDALAMAGDINDYGNLRKVKIVRSNNNKKKVYFFDLTESKILESNFYYLNNKDLVYVQPTKFKGLKKSQSQILLSSLTTFAVLFNAFINFRQD